MPFWLYILRCADGSFYTGHTDALEVRLAEHQSGKYPGYVSRRRPVTLVFSQEFSTREEALSAESRVKGWSRTKKEALVQGDWGALSELAVRRSPDAPR